MRLSCLFVVALLAVAPAATHAVAHPSSQAAPAGAAAVVAEVRGILAARYVLPERRPALDAVLADGLASGRYAVDDPLQLAERINADLERVGQDKHLNFRFNPAAASLAQQADGTFDEAAYAQMVRALNHGVRELRVLPGNVRLLTYDGFHYDGANTERVLDSALAFLTEGDAIIIDLRQNGGGDTMAVRRLISPFVTPGTPLVTFLSSDEPDPQLNTSFAVGVTPDLRGRPLYVLTSGRTGSAAEEFSGHVAGYHLGELVGETTAGAAFNNDVVAVGDGFVLSVSFGRPVLAATGGDWEGVGIAPTIAVSADAALDTAYSRALTRLAVDATGADRDRLVHLSAVANARATDVAPAQPLAAYSGAYGERKIRMADGRLVYQRGNGPLIPLLPIGGDRFVFDQNPEMLLTATMQDGGATAITFQRIGLPPQGPYARTGD